MLGKIVFLQNSSFPKTFYRPVQPGRLTIDMRCIMANELELNQEIDNARLADQATQATGEYSEEQIQVLEGLEAVRKRPGM